VRSIAIDNERSVFDRREDNTDMHKRHMLMKYCIRPLTMAAALSSLLHAPAAAQHSGDMLIGSTADGGGALAVEYEFAAPIPVTFVTEVGGTSLYTATDPGFDALGTDEPAESFFVLDGGTQVSVEITALEPGKTAMNLNGTLLDTVGESVVLGSSPNLHEHPEWQLILAMPAGEFGEGTLSFKLTTTSGSYTESESYTVTLSNGHLAPVEYDTGAYDSARVKCRQTIGKEIRKLLAAEYQLLAKCLDKIQVAEARAEAGLDAASAENAAAGACGDAMVAKATQIETKAKEKIAAKCGSAGSNDYGPEAIAAHVGMATCRAEELISASYPGAQGHLGEYQANGQPTDTYFPCLTPSGAHEHEE
jgi:hypothetical protein